MSQPLIHLHGIDWTQAGRCRLRIADLTIHAGEKVAILGRNGAGKSSLLKLINGFASPDRGHVQVGGQSVFPVPPAQRLRQLRRKVGQVPQGLHLVSRLSVQDNVLVGGLAAMPLFRSCLRVFTPAELQAAEQAMAAVGVLHLRQVRADRLSGGERQKVAIARLLIQAPELVLADEPTAALDPTAASEVIELLRAATRQTTLLTVVHQVDQVPLLADRVLGLRAGELVLDCPSQSLNTSLLGDLYG